MNANAEKSLGTEIGLIFLDKLLLGFVILVIGYLFNLQLQKRQTVTSYQQKIFDSRLTSYIDILKSAKKTFEFAKGFYIVTDTTKRVAKTLHSIQRKWKNRGSGFSGGAGGEWIEIDQVAEQLLKLDSIRVENDFYLSEEIRINITLFINTLTNDIDKISNRMQSNEEFKINEEYTRLERVYNQLIQSIRERLKVDKIELG